MAIGLIGFLTAEIVPVYVKNYELKHAAKRIAQLSSTNVQSSKSIHDDLYQKAREIGLPVQHDDIVVSATVKEAPISGTGALLEDNAPAAEVAVVAIEISYAVPIRLPGFTWRLHFHIHADDHSI